MPQKNLITADTEDEIWKIIADQLAEKNDNLDYTAQFTALDHLITLDIDIHPDRGEENEKHATSFSTELSEETSFRFSIEKQGLKHEIGKLFGTQDVIIGQPEFDKKYLIQSNDPAKVKEVLVDDGVCTELLKHPVINFEIADRKIAVHKHIVLLLDMEGGITEADKLKDVFQSFKIVLGYMG